MSRNDEELAELILGTKKPTKEIMLLSPAKLHPFENHPFQVKDDEEMDTLVESIKENGVLSPIIVCPKENTADEYEIISGHRRFRAAQKAGLASVPVLIYTLDRDTAAVAVVDSNLHRDRLLPSEKAFAYKMKMNALKHQGKATEDTSRQVGGRSETADVISDTDSGRQVQRYIRLTHLIPELLQYVDDGRIALSPAVALSYLNDREQKDLLAAMEYCDCTPSLSQAVKLKEMSKSDICTHDAITALLSQEKANQKEQIKFKQEDLQRYFPRDYTPEQMTETILKLLESWQRKRERNRGDAR